MDTSYGIGIANRYALFMGDEDQEPGSQSTVAPAKGKENKTAIVPKKVPAVPSARTSGSSKPTAPATGNKSNATTGPNNKNVAPGQGPRNASGPRGDRTNESRGPRSENQKSGEGGPRGPRQDRPPRGDQQRDQGAYFIIFPPVATVVHGIKHELGHNPS